MNLFGASWDPATGFAGAMTSGSPDAYAVLGIGTHTNNSNSFANWSSSDAAVLGFTPASFSLYVFRLSGTLNAKGYLQVTLPAGLPQGTYAIAYGQNGKGDAYDTPFTDAGQTQGPHFSPPRLASVPEPSSAVLMVLGLAALGAAYLRRKRRGVAAA